MRLQDPVDSEATKFSPDSAVSDSDEDKKLKAKTKSPSRKGPGPPSPMVQAVCNGDDVADDQEEEDSII